MMIERIVSGLKAAGAEDWKIVEKRNDGLEWYFIGKTLDTARSVTTASYDVSVYSEGSVVPAKTRGECAVKIQSGAGDAEIASILRRAAATAAAMDNPWYPLTEPSSEAPARISSGFDSLPRGEGMERVRAALYAHDGLDGATINSLELFLRKVSTRIVNSRGVDVDWSLWRGNGEFIVNAGRGSGEIELYSEFEFSEPDTERLSETVRRQLVAARDRLVAVATPDCAGLPLLLSGELAEQVYGYYLDNLDGHAVYEKFSNFNLGDQVGKEGGTGDRVELSAVPLAKGCPNGAPYDGSGFLLKGMKCIEAGRVVRLVTSVKYAHYLNLPATGILPLFVLAPGSLAEKELRSMPHIEAVTFSDFFVDTTTGDFGGEIRLAYIHRDGKRIPVTGGSITGSVTTNRGELLLSREVEAKSRSLSPVACLIPIVTVSPAT